MLKSNKAFSLLKHIESEPADGKIYSIKRYKRDKDAREQYLKKERNTARRNDDIFMIDVIREEMKRYDPRLQRNISV